MQIWSSEKLKINPLNNNASKVFLDVVKRLSKVKYWVSAGTALGLYRDGDFIKDDTDLDFAFIGCEIKDLFDDYELVRAITYKGRPMQLCYLRDGVLVDFYFHYEEDGKYINYSENGKQVMEMDVYDNLKILKTKYGMLPFPDPEKYLKIRYGNFRTLSKEKPPFEKI